jgi:RNA polymerase sigma-70 factor (ECF subfamily)
MWDRVMTALVRTSIAAPASDDGCVRAMEAASPPDDDALVARATAGSRPAFEELVRRHQKGIYFLCLRYVRDHDAAADLAQRTFIRAFEKVTELRDARTFRGWLYRIAANLSLNHLRDHARFVDEEDAYEAALPPDAPAALEAGEESAALRLAVAQLPTKQRMTLELRVYEDLPFKDIAQALGTTEGAAKVNFHYAVGKLRALLGAAGGREAGRGGASGRGRRP